MGHTEDGDFIALKQRREEKKKGHVETKDLRFRSIKKKVDPVIDFTDNNNDRPKVAELWPSIEDAVLTDDLDKLNLCLKSLGDMKFSEPEFHSIDDKFELQQNCLHLALNGKHYKAAEFLMNMGDETLILGDFEIIVKTIISKKSCLHILSEQNDNKLTILLLSKIKDKTTLKHFLNRTVLTEMEGQRPRQLAAIHIAASLGNSELIEYLVAMGVSPSFINSKNDTPILWASRFDHKDTVKCLLRLGAQINKENDKGSTALYWAVRYGYPGMVELLCDLGKANVHQRRKLGLVCPLVLAAAFGYTDILNILLKYGADVNTRINGGVTALHHASMEGNPECIAILLDNGADKEATDEMGNTALILATREHHLRSIAALISYGASIDAKNRAGTMVWDYAIASEDWRLLTALVNVVKEMKGGDEPYLFVGVNTPLHIAAKKGDCDKISCLLGLGLDAASTDTDGNTFMHLAAKENKYEVLEKFLHIADLGTKNGMGERPLHIACRAGNLEALKSVILHSDISSLNNMGETGSTPISGACALHLAAKSHQASSEVLSYLIEIMLKTTHWSLVDCQDSNGNTALHSAAQAGRQDIIAQLAFINPTLKNNDGDNPLHLAANRENWKTLEVMLKIFNNTGKGFNIDHPTNDGKTLLHICACNGDYERVAHIIDLGADLSIISSEDNTIMHSIVKNTVLDPSKIDAFIKVYFAIVEKSTQWWCLRHELIYPDTESDLYRTYRRLCIQYLTGELLNDQGKTVIGYAASIGALPILKVILHSSNIYTFHESSRIMYDVTNMTPKSMAFDASSGDNTQKGAYFYAKRKSRVGVVTREGQEDEEVGQPNVQKCLLEILVRMPDEKAATDILDIAPIRQLVQNYWSSYQWLFFALMSVHTGYMVLFSVYFLPYMEIRYVNATAVLMPMENLAAHPTNYLLLVWPLPLIAFECYHIPMGFRRSYAAPVSMNAVYYSLMTPAVSCVRFARVVLANLTHIACLTFSLIVICFVVAIQRGYIRTSLYLLAASMFVGWMFTIAYTRGFETVHSLSTMLQHIIINDVTRFLFIYAFVLTGFGFAIHSLIHLSADVAERFPTAWHSLFFTFNLMVGMADHDFDQEFDTAYHNSGSRSIWVTRRRLYLLEIVKIVYILYMILATVILLNMLIAMLSDTYSGVAASESTSWRVGSLKLALQIESSMPFIPEFFAWIGLTRERVEYHPIMKRYVLYSGKKSIASQQKLGGSRKEAVELLLSVENRVNQLYLNQENISCKLDNIIQVLSMESTAGQAAKHWLGSRGGQKKSLNNMLAETRPKSSHLRVT